MPGFSQPGDADAPEVRLGALAQGGLAPAIMAIVERGVTRRPDQARALGIEVELSDLVALLVAPLVGGVPSPMNARGRAALGMFASRRVRIDGGLGLMRSFLAVIRL